MINGTRPAVRLVVKLVVTVRFAGAISSFGKLNVMVSVPLNVEVIWLAVPNTLYVSVLNTMVPEPVSPAMFIAKPPDVSSLSTYALILSEVARVVALAVPSVSSSMMSVTLTAPVPLRLSNSNVPTSTVPVTLILPAPTSPVNVLVPVTVRLPEMVGSSTIPIRMVLVPSNAVSSSFVVPTTV